MSHLASTLDEFGQSLHLQRLVLNSNGVAVLRIDDLGTLYIERHEAGLALLLARELSFPEPRRLEKALALCHPQENLSFAPMAALQGDRKLVFAGVLAEEAVTVPALQRMLEELGHLHQRVTE